MSEEEQKYFKGLIGFTFDSDDIRYIEKIVDKKDKEIERLNNLLKETSQTLSKQTTKAITLKSENERLNKELKSLQDSYDIQEELANYHIDLTDDLREEVDRLNNIINEFEQYLKYKWYEMGEDTPLDEVLDKFQALKDSDKE